MNSRHILLATAGSILLCFQALHNKYPYLTTDSGAFIQAGFESFPKTSGAVPYGIFIVHTGWGTSLWPVVFIQTGLLSLILFYYFRYFERMYYYLIFVCCITFFTSASIVTGTISPGIFSCIAVLCTGLLLFIKGLSVRDAWIICIIAIISMLMDVSSLLTVMILALLFIFRWINNRTALRWIIIPVAAALLLPLCDLPPLHRISNFSSDLRITEYERVHEHTNTYFALNRWYSWEVREYQITRQYQNWLSLFYLNYAQMGILIAGGFATIWLIIKKKIKIELLLFFMCAIVTLTLMQKILYGNSNDITTQRFWLLLLPLFICLPERPASK
jgi:hypothetical protein